nr:MAG: hypothetical protein [Bacteriophage sp.]
MFCPLWYNSSVDFQRVPAIVSVFFILAQETLRDFIEKIEYVFILRMFLKPFITSFLAVDTSKVFGFF